MSYYNVGISYVGTTGCSNSAGSTMPQVSIHDAVLHCDLDEYSNCVESGQGVNDLDSDGYSPLDRLVLAEELSAGVDLGRFWKMLTLLISDGATLSGASQKNWSTYEEFCLKPKATHLDWEDYDGLVKILERLCVGSVKDRIPADFQHPQRMKVGGVFSSEPDYADFYKKFKNGGYTPDCLVPFFENDGTRAVVLSGLPFPKVSMEAICTYVEKVNSRRFSSSNRL